MDQNVPLDDRFRREKRRGKITHQLQGRCRYVIWATEGGICVTPLVYRQRRGRAQEQQEQIACCNNYPAGHVKQGNKTYLPVSSQGSFSFPRAVKHLNSKLEAPKSEPAGRQRRANGGKGRVDRNSRKRHRNRSISSCIYPTKDH